MFSEDTSSAERQGAVEVAQEATKVPSQEYSATLAFTPSHAEVGTTVAVQGTGYPADEEVELVWYTMEGRYELEGGTEFIGQSYEERSDVLTTVRADDAGTIETELEVPLP